MRPPCGRVGGRVRRSVRQHPIAILGRSFLALAAIVAASAAPLGAQGPVPGGRYVPPADTFLIDPAETRITLSFGTAPLADIQTQLDAARAANPDTPIALTLRGSYTVSDTPLSLPSKTSLVLYGSIRAARHATAASLIAIVGQSQVGIAGGHLQGRGADLAGILVDASSKVNIDDVTVSDTRRDGIVFGGKGVDAWNQGSAITRCEVTRAGGNGMTVRGSTQTLLIDNFVHHNAGAGVQISSAFSSIVNNTITGNETGIVTEANDILVADNAVRANRRAGIRLAATSSETIVLRNIVALNRETGIDLDGGNHLIYNNTLQNHTDLTEHENATNWVVPRGRALAAPISRYFRPPTMDDPHTETIMNGVARTDVTIASTTIEDVQAQYDAARLAHPDDVLVLHLQGEFVLGGGPLQLGSNTVVLLDGAIRVTSTTAPQAIIAANPSSFIAISGGTVDCGGRVMEGIYFPSTTMAHVDGVTITHCGETLPRSVSNSLHFQRGGGYAIIRGNRIDISGGRCIWTQNSNTRFVALENHTSRCNQDGVDFDSTGADNVAIDNLSEDSLRYGIFIEQSDMRHVVYGNYTTTRGLDGRAGRGIGVYNNATAASTRNVTDKNTVFSNISDTINNGLRVGSIASAAGGRAETRHTFLFNNIVRNSQVEGILFDAQFERSVENYFSQTVFEGNVRDLTVRTSNGGAPPEFFNPFSAVNYALKRSIAASSSAPGFDPAGAIDGLPGTGWIAGFEFRPSLTIDLGADATFQRVTLRQPLPLAPWLVRVLTSADGVTFTPAPAPWRLPEQVTQITFPAVTARYVRLQFEGAFLLPVALQDAAVHPQ
jgi:nitrous oxidase accessory protein NosD